MDIVPAGDRALLAGLGECSGEHLHAAAARTRELAGVVACIPGHSSLYVVFDRPVIASDRVAVAAVCREPGPWTPPATRVHRLRVRFDAECGPDLGELAARAGMDAILRRLASLRLTVRYLGFRGGFAYLDGWPDEWAMPRRATPRPRVPRGTFAIAGSAAGFYPIDSPGGWNLLGRTDANLEHALRPGDELVIEPSPVALEFPTAPRREIRRPFEGVVEVSAAPLARLVAAPDWSRIEEGVPPGGAFDDMAASLANLAVGNAADAPLLECAIAGPKLRFLRDCVAAWCGPDLRVRAWRARAGEEHAIGRITGGLRGYLSIGETEGVMAALERGDRHVIRVAAGPHACGIEEIECEVTPQLDRVGIRLRPLRPAGVAIPADLRSAGMQCGTVQLHPDGSLVAMGPDHPVTGGYLQPFTALSAERWKLAQLTAGERVVFRVAGPC